MVDSGLFLSESQPFLAATPDGWPGYLHMLWRKLPGNQVPILC